MTRSPTHRFGYLFHRFLWVELPFTHSIQHPLILDKFCPTGADYTDIIYREFRRSEDTWIP